MKWKANACRLRFGLGTSYEFSARLMSRFSRELQARNPLCLTTIRIELPGQTQEAGGVDAIKRRVLESYGRMDRLDSDALRVKIETSPLEEFFARFPNTQSDQWLQNTFSEMRTREGDYGYFIRRSDELVFCNLIPMRPNQQAKKIMKLVSTTCERQFSKQRPALLWLHLQGLEPNQIENDPKLAESFLRKLARHAFTNDRRSHVSSLVFTSDSDLDHQHASYLGKDRRRVKAIGHMKGYDNPRCRFGQVHILAPLFSSEIQ